jgi:hypothetical protein
MYWLQTDSSSDPTRIDPGSGGRLEGLNYAIEMEKAFTDAFSIARIEKFYLTLEDSATKLNRQIGNGLVKNLENIQSTIYSVYKEGLEYGFAFGDAKDFITEIGDGLGRTQFYQSENIKVAIGLGKAMGVTSKEVATMVKDLMVMGIGPEKANEILTKTFLKARSYGVDASKLTATVSKNILQAQAYGFKDGVDGLTKMAIQAQRLGINMEQAMNAAEGLLDPEKAIEAASSIQMLGGAAGALADPFQLMHLAQSDVGELQNQIGKTTASMVKFNSATGEFKIDPAMRRDMTQLAQSLGMDYKTVADMAIKFRKEQEVASQTKLFSTLTEEEKSLVSSMAEIKNGQVMIKIPGQETMIEASKLTSAKIEEMKKAQAVAEADKDPLVIARNQLTVQEKMELSLEKIRTAGALGIDYNKGKKLYENLENMADSEKVGQLQEKIMDGFQKNIQDVLVNYYGKALKEYEKNMTKLIKLTDKAITDLQTALAVFSKGSSETPPEDAGRKGTEIPGDDVYIPAGTNKTISTGFGNLINLNKGDASLNIPQEDMDRLLSYANLGDKMSKMVPNSKMTESKVGTLTNYIEQKIVTETTSKQEVNVGGSADINIKIDSNIPQNMLDKIIDNPELKRTIMSQINERLSKSFKEKLINPLT